MQRDAADTDVALARARSNANKHAVGRQVGRKCSENHDRVPAPHVRLIEPESDPREQ